MPDEQFTSSESSAEAPSRPWGVTLLAFGVLSITVLGFLRAYLAVRGWRFLESWPGVSPLYLTASGLLLGALGALVFWAIATRKRWTMRLTEAAVLSVALGFWLDQIFVAEHPFSDPAGASQAFLPVNWPFAAAVTVMIMLYVELMRRNARVKAYFGDEHE